MKRKLSMVALLTFALLGLTAALIQADFIQCVALANCGYSDNPDIINGSDGDDIIRGFEGADIIFAGDGNDWATGDEHDDVVFGGLGADNISGLDGDDILLAGPDLPNMGQFVIDTDGNDTANVLVGEVSACLIILDVGTESGVDVVNLIGFGPYVVTKPFGIPGFAEGWIHVVDPIAGGDIYIYVDEDSNEGSETINGLLSPNVTFLAGDVFSPAEVNDCSMSVPHEVSPPTFPQPSNAP